MTVTGSFRRWERFMFIFVGVEPLMLPLAFMVHASCGTVLHGTVVPGVQGACDSTALLLIIAIVGTTVAPWQLFFQQSNVVDKRITPRWIKYERWDTVIGAVLTVIGAAALMIACGLRLQGHGLRRAVRRRAGRSRRGSAASWASSPVPSSPLSCSTPAIIGAAAVTLSTSYAFGDVFGVSHSLHRGVGEAKSSTAATRRSW